MGETEKIVEVYYYEGHDGEFYFKGNRGTEMKVCERNIVAFINSVGIAKKVKKIELRG